MSDGPAAGRREVGTTLTIGPTLAWGRARLEATEIDTPRLDADVLLAAVLGVDRARLIIDAGEPLQRDAAERFAAWVARRAAREPVAYIVGRRGFRRITVDVDPRVLIPRPETELLVEAALELPAGARVLDVGTGSGAVALALADERPDLEVWASDVSDDALAVARSNAERLGLDVRFLAADLLTGALADAGWFDAVLSNPPYVPDGAPLAPEITGFEPAGALFAGPDGLDVVRRLVAGAAGRAGMLAIEIGADQGAGASELMAAAGWTGVEIRRDLAGLDRVVVGRATE